MNCNVEKGKIVTYVKCLEQVGSSWPFNLEPIFYHYNILRQIPTSK